MKTKKPQELIYSFFWNVTKGFVITRRGIEVATAKNKKEAINFINSLNDSYNANNKSL